MAVEEKFLELLDIMKKLRSPGGCPWDLEQDHQSIASYCIEEAYEVVEAIEKNNSRELCEELGDLLLQVVFHAQMASEANSFSMIDVIENINKKMIRRHPHVFSKDSSNSSLTANEVLEQWEEIKAKEREQQEKEQAHVPATAGWDEWAESRLGPEGGKRFPPSKKRTANEVLEQWEEIKAKEREQQEKEQAHVPATAGWDEWAESRLGPEGGKRFPPSKKRFDGLPKALPALQRAQRVGEKASKVGFDWKDVRGVWEKLDEEIDELKAASKSDQEEELGDMLFNIVNLSRHLQIDAEQSLRRATKKFEERFNWVEKQLEAQQSLMKDRSEAELTELWEQAKKELKKTS